jgi:hypothetical protein
MAGPGRPADCEISTYHNLIEKMTCQFSKENDWGKRDKLGGREKRIEWKFWIGVPLTPVSEATTCKS